MATGGGSCIHTPHHQHLATCWQHMQSELLHNMCRHTHTHTQTHPQVHLPITQTADALPSQSNPTCAPLHTHAQVLQCTTAKLAATFRAPIASDDTHQPTQPPTMSWQATCAHTEGSLLNCQWQSMAELVLGAGTDKRQAGRYTVLLLGIQSCPCSQTLALCPPI